MGGDRGGHPQVALSTLRALVKSRRSERQRAGLVEDDGVDLGQALQRRCRP